MTETVGPRRYAWTLDDMRLMDEGLRRHLGRPLLEASDADVDELVAAIEASSVARGAALDQVRAELADCEATAVVWDTVRDDIRRRTGGIG